MIETMIASSILILIITILRYLLKGRISLKLMYGLWLLVAIRLLLPFPLFESSISVMNALPNEINATVPFTAPASGEGALPMPVEEMDTREAPRIFDYRVAAKVVWIGGSVLTGIFFLSVNRKLSQMLRRRRRAIEMPDCPLPVYIASGLPSPCLYGMVRPAIYLTEESLLGGERSAHIIAHELTHYRHGDHIWSLVRVVCVCIHWFNPFVWTAAKLSKRDSELACDEGTIKRLGQENRIAYGKTLIEMMTVSPKVTDLFCLATTMTGGKGEIAERIKLIAKKPKVLSIVIIAVIAVVIAAVAVTFSGGVEKAPPGAAGSANSARAERGLELYVWKDINLTGNNAPHFTLLPVTERNKEKTEIYNLAASKTSIEDVGNLLERYDDNSNLQIYRLNETDFTKEQVDKYASQLEKFLPRDHTVSAKICWMKDTAWMSFWVKPDEPPEVIGRVAAMRWLESLKSKNEPEMERILDYTIEEIKVTADEQLDKEALPSYLVQVSYGITTATDGYWSEREEISGKGVFTGLKRELCINSLGDGNYQVVSLAFGEE